MPRQKSITPHTMIRRQIKRVDKIPACFEAAQLVLFTDAKGRKLFCNSPPFHVTLTPEKPDIVKGRYLERFHTLSKGI